MKMNPLTSTDDGVKRSAKGLLRVEFEDGNFVLYDQQTLEQSNKGLLKVVFRDSTMINNQTLQEIRTNLGTF